MQKPKVVNAYNSGMGGVHFSDTYFTSHCSMKWRKTIRYLLSELIFTTRKKNGSSISRIEFQEKLIQYLISRYHMTVKRLSGRPPNTAPSSRMNAPHYPSYIAVSVKAKSMSALSYVLPTGLTL
jgi:hypothetical protein